MGELLIAAGPGEWRAAWVADGAAIELYVERGDTKPPGSRHLGRVVRVVTGLDAALVDIGDERPGFLPLRDVPAGVKAEEGARIVVTVRREAWADKAPRLAAMPPGFGADAGAGREPPAQLSPAPGLAPALALRLPAAPSRIVADDAAPLAALRSTFPAASVAYEPAGDWPIDLDAAFAAALAPSLVLAQGVAVHVDEVRAATLIDVDTGTPVSGGSARAALAANRAAASVIARELRLRNIGGAVTIDFVGLERRDHRDQIRRTLEAALAGDPAAPQVLGWTRLGHLELTRVRRGRSLADAMLAPGERAVLPLALAHEALRGVLRAARANPAANWRLSVPRAVEAALRGPAAAALAALETRLGRRLAIVAEPRREGFDIAPL
ncbi:MAG TPA: ribonuclease E/G [Stellaceae bacterium]|nr:ribonuclease E/G [Stellaceae bacterium]